MSSPWVERARRRGAKNKISRSANTRNFAPETRRLDIDGFAPAGFAGGVEILNDRSTPMDVVVRGLPPILSRCSGMGRG